MGLFLLTVMNFIKVRKYLAGSLFGIILIAGGYFLGVQGFKAKVDQARKVEIVREVPPDKNIEFSLFWKVWDTLANRYFDQSKLIPVNMVYGAIQGMVASLGDPYTVFLPPSENKVVQEDLNGSFEGVGIQIGFRSARLAVIAPLSDSPAEHGGIKAGDFILRIKDDGKKLDIGTSGITLPDAVQAIRGKSGTKVTLTLAREGVSDPIVVDLIREKLEVPSVELDMVGEGEKIAHIQVNKFSSETTKEWNEITGQILKAAGVKSVIIDLRNNPGGYLQSAVDLAGDFVERGEIVVIEERGDGARNEFKSEGAMRLAKYNVVILINGGSASASEILAGALRDQKKIKILGEKSFGKGTIQEPIEIPGGSGLHITTAKWLTPNGIWINEVGIAPDTEITDDEATVEDEQLLRAIGSFN